MGMYCTLYTFITKPNDTRHIVNFKYHRHNINSTIAVALHPLFLCVRARLHVDYTIQIRDMYASFRMIKRTRTHIIDDFCLIIHCVGKKKSLSNSIQPYIQQQQRFNKIPKNSHHSEEANVYV